MQMSGSTCQKGLRTPPEGEAAQGRQQRCPRRPCPAVAALVGQPQQLLGGWQHGVAVTQQSLAVTVPQALSVTHPPVVGTAACTTSSWWRWRPAGRGRVCGAAWQRRAPCWPVLGGAHPACKGQVIRQAATAQATAAVCGGEMVMAEQGGAHSLQAHFGWQWACSGSKCPSLADLDLQQQLLADPVHVVGPRVEVQQGPAPAHVGQVDGCKVQHALPHMSGAGLHTGRRHYSLSLQPEVSRSQLSASWLVAWRSIQHQHSSAHSLLYVQARRHIRGLHRDVVGGSPREVAPQGASAVCQRTR